ncbi:MAG: thiamine-phosphate kinase [Pseudomonadota bacterium]
MNERDIIARLQETLARDAAGRSGVILGIGDDGAVLEVPPGQHLVTVMDTVVAGVHFPDTTAPEDIGYRALAVNLSDLAAMAATPAWATLSLTLPLPDPAWVDAFARGWAAASVGFDVALVGGDTVRGPLAVSVALHGLVRRGEELTRTGARPGDAVYVTGTPGDAAAGLEVCEGRLAADAAVADTLRRRFLRPTPRVVEGRSLAGVASAALDISDGLALDAGRLASASGVEIVLEADALPLSPALVQAVGEERGGQLALAGGDDYELLFAVPVEAQGALQAASLAWQCGCRRIGHVEEGSGVTLLHEGKSVPLPAAFEHFSSASGEAIEQ